LRGLLATSGLRLRRDEQADEKLAKLRSLYEPYVQATARSLLIDLPSWMPAGSAKDNWQSGPWDKKIQKKGLENAARVFVDDHF
jgi:hypothetical protein